MIELDKDSYEDEPIEGLNLSNSSVAGKEFYRCKIKDAILRRRIYHVASSRIAAFSNAIYPTR